ncbi:serine/threonine-protein phosphatase [bacterium]|nr:serine/threonine-protein phosphatase [bacterium]
MRLLPASENPCPPQPAILQWAALSHSGSRKPRNDDSLIVFASALNGANILPASGRHSLTRHDLVFAVSDGMGGGNAGDIASSLILRQMTEIIPETFKAAASGIYPDSISHLGDALRNIHEQINRAGEGCADQSGMAATLALAWFTPDNLYLANAGDSRVYRSRSGSLEQLSRDHTSAWGQWKRGEISEIQYRGHPRRAALYEILGGGHPKVNPHYAAVAYQPGDRFLICSDGLIDGLWERHISDALAACPVDPAATAANLLKRAIDNAGIDDTSLIVITVTSPEGER